MLPSFLNQVGELPLTAQFDPTNDEIERKKKKIFMKYDFLAPLSKVSNATKIVSIGCRHHKIWMFYSTGCTGGYIRKTNRFSSIIYCIQKAFPVGFN